MSSNLITLKNNKRLPGEMVYAVDLKSSFYRFKSDGRYVINIIKSINLGTSPSGKAVAFEAKMRRFDPCRPNF